jgi:hypothetical protein
LKAEGNKYSQKSLGISTPIFCNAFAIAANKSLSTLTKMRRSVAFCVRHASVLPYLGDTPACCLIWTTRQRVVLFGRHASVLPYLTKHAGVLSYFGMIYYLFMRMTRW